MVHIARAAATLDRSPGSALWQVYVACQYQCSDVFIDMFSIWMTRNCPPPPGAAHFLHPCVRWSQIAYLH
jgi:hypothetical protein